MNDTCYECGKPLDQEGNCIFVCKGEDFFVYFCSDKCYVIDQEMEVQREKDLEDSMEMEA